jgi:hypothetical protein
VPQVLRDILRRVVEQSGDLGLSQPDGAADRPKPDRGALILGAVEDQLAVGLARCLRFLSQVLTRPPAHFYMERVSVYHSIKIACLALHTYVDFNSCVE